MSFGRQRKEGNDNWIQNLTGETSVKKIMWKTDKKK